jgi:hypothetical protein
LKRGAAVSKNLGAIALAEEQVGRRWAVLISRTFIEMSAITISCSIVKCYSGKIALPPNHAALPGCVKIIERQFKVQRQDVTVLQPNSCASVRNIVNCASEYAAPRVEVEQRALRDRRSTN